MNCLPKNTSSSWWFQPIRKICSSHGMISPSRGENQTCLSCHHLEYESIESFFKISPNPSKQFHPTNSTTKFPFKIHQNPKKIPLEMMNCLPKNTSSSWWFQPIRKICSSHGIISPSRDENKTCLSCHHLEYESIESFLKFLPTHPSNSIQPIPPPIFCLLCHQCFLPMRFSAGFFFPQKKSYRWPPRTRLRRRLGLVFSGATWGFEGGREG